MIEAPFFFVPSVPLCFYSLNPLTGFSRLLKHRDTEDTEV